jgi:hypothetical protein
VKQHKVRLGRLADGLSALTERSKVFTAAQQLAAYCLWVLVDSVLAVSPPGFPCTSTSCLMIVVITSAAR